MLFNPDKLFVGNKFMKSFFFHFQKETIYFVEDKTIFQISTFWKDYKPEWIIGAVTLHIAYNEKYLYMYGLSFN